MVNICSRAVQCGHSFSIYFDSSLRLVQLFTNFTQSLLPELFQLSQNASRKSHQIFNSLFVSSSVFNMAITQDNHFWVESEDWHTAGEPFRIISKYPPHHEMEGENVAQRRLNIIGKPEHPLDLLRQSLCHEPRGHADMYGGFITPPDDSSALFGVLFWHKDGFSTACGHGTIALGYWAIAHKMLPVPENGVVDVVIDVPSGRVISRITTKDFKPIHAEFIQVLSYQIAKDVMVTIPSLGFDITTDLIYSGAVYASIDASQLNLEVEPKNCYDFIKIGREFRASLGKRGQYRSHDLYAIIFFNEDGDSQDEANVIRQRNVVVFADGQIDRSPCGSGTAARVTTLLNQGRFKAGISQLRHRSIIGTTFEADVVSEEACPIENFKGCIPRVRGQAYLVGRMNFFIDPADPVFPGFLLR
ncbi:hypothetical protein EDB81DRAFT_791637 [Dactylonectria macrodidyma]|uniref:trans-L-3-hydroxyproline dehydratase n=1 Tax=Dactylonectria macrodidyma TaxID=307937 RepID=A0A9P9F7G1_9HYPO|nr:hypothetical protein EDB81DRAFT_791637 [Dactylonectria macrodidyma]